MAKFDDAQTITGEVNINYVLTAYSKKLNSIMGENILLQAKVSELEEQNNNKWLSDASLITKYNKNLNSKYSINLDQA